MQIQTCSCLIDVIGFYNTFRYRKIILLTSVNNTRVMDSQLGSYVEVEKQLNFIEIYAI